MGRTIVTRADQARAEADPKIETPPERDSTLSALAKYIPGEIITVYTTALVFAAKVHHIAQWVALAGAILLVYLYHRKARRVPFAFIEKPVQLWVTMIAFLLHAYITGGPFTQLGCWHNEYVGLLIAVFFVPIVTLCREQILSPATER